MHWFIVVPIALFYAVVYLPTMVARALMVAVSMSWEHAGEVFSSSLEKIGGDMGWEEDPIEVELDERTAENRKRYDGSKTVGL